MREKSSAYWQSIRLLKAYPHWWRQHRSAGQDIALSMGGTEPLLPILIRRQFVIKKILLHSPKAIRPLVKSEHLSNSRCAESRNRPLFNIKERTILFPHQRYRSAAGCLRRVYRIGNSPIRLSHRCTRWRLASSLFLSSPILLLFSLREKSVRRCGILQWRCKVFPKATAI